MGGYTLLLYKTKSAFDSKKGWFYAAAFSPGGSFWNKDKRTLRKEGFRMKKYYDGVKRFRVVPISKYPNTKV